VPAQASVAGEYQPSDDRRAAVGRAARPARISPTMTRCDATLMMIEGRLLTEGQRKHPGAFEW